MPSEYLCFATPLILFSDLGDLGVMPALSMSKGRLIRLKIVDDFSSPWSSVLATAKLQAVSGSFAASFLFRPLHLGVLGVLAVHAP